MAVNYGEIIKDTAEGLLAYVTNELRNYAKNNDASKVRIGAPGDHGGCLSFNKLWIDPNTGVFSRETELGLFQIKQDERTRADVNGSRGELTIHLSDGDESKPEDDRQRPVLLIRTDGYTWLVPNITNPEHPPDNGGSETPVGDYDGAQFYGSEGKFLYARQSDHHDVLYRVDDHGALHPIWVSDGGQNGTWLG